MPSESHAKTPRENTGRELEEPGEASDPDTSLTPGGEEREERLGGSILDCWSRRFSKALGKSSRQAVCQRGLVPSMGMNAPASGSLLLCTNPSTNPAQTQPWISESIILLVAEGL